MYYKVTFILIYREVCFKNLKFGSSLRRALQLALELSNINNQKSIEISKNPNLIKLNIIVYMFFHFNIILKYQ